MTLESYQEEASIWLSKHKRGIVVAPAGSGKTLIAAAALNRVVLSKPRTDKVKVGWICNTVEQGHQASDALEKFPYMLPHVHLRIACAASNLNWSSRDVLIVDECHHSAAPEWRRQIETSDGALWGFTATPDSDDEARNIALVELFGCDRFVVNRESVKNRLCPATYTMLNATDSDIEKKIDAEIQRTFAWRKRFWKRDEGELWGQIAWQKCVEIGIVQNRLRNQAVIETAKNHSRDSVLILVNQVDHGSLLAERIPGAAVCHSKMGAKKRREALEAFRNGSLRCIVATSGIAEEGLDVPRAAVLINVAGGRSSRATEQRIGRIARVFAGKEMGVAYDFEDNFHPLARKHSWQRVAIYRKLGYERQA